MVARGARDRYNRTRHRIRARHSKGAVGSYPAVSQWGASSGPYLQQSMPGWWSDLSYCQLFTCLFAIVLLTGGCSYAGFTCWLGAEEVELDYTNCAITTAACNSSNCSGSGGGSGGGSGAECSLKLSLNSRLTSPLYVYYAMRNAYFNHRRVQTSWSMHQVLGLPLGNLSLACRGRTYRGGLPVLPCGVLPEAIFNDTIRVLGPLGDDGADPEEVRLSTDGITWRSHSTGLYRELKPEQLAGTVPPASWQLPASKRYQRPFVDADDLHTWLLTPAFSCFRKMSHRVLANGGLPKGNYRVLIGYNYPVKGFSGVKSFIIGKKTFLGGKNIVLALLPAVTCMCYLVMCIAILIECRCGAN